MSDKRKCPVCHEDLEFEADTYCGGTCADIAEMRKHDDERIADLRTKLDAALAREAESNREFWRVTEERDAALESVKKLAKCAGLDGAEPIAELSTYIQQLQRDLRGVHARLCGALGVGAGLLEDLTDAVAHIRMGYNAANAELAALRQCSTCCGTPHASGLPCICGGTNRAEDELKNLRLESMVLRDAVTRMGEELKYKHDPEFQGAYLAWRGLTEHERHTVDIFLQEHREPHAIAWRLLKAAAR